MSCRRYASPAQIPPASPSSPSSWTPCPTRTKRPTTANAIRNDAASSHITFAAPRNAINTPASAGPSRLVMLPAPSTRLFAWASCCSPSPTTAGRINRWQVKYAHPKVPSRTATTRIKVNDSPPTAFRSGTSATIGARAASAISIEVLGPRRCTTEPAGMPSSAIGASSAAKTRPIFVGEPVVTRTNQGSAR